ncbi:Inosose isomerase [Maioricimonas rarisocia]|uniref:Inosose isomerase n=1 Tax=Maioricimonas rarisocia TaxID=2528026 RepID=A0A517Z2D3_9PLAN|nr:sugar phosphate isomerase/epimerase family protein [Maioricimonas rarisocia]QDU36627.1 Inosose isomerase [Maioricimonas rarisocia]
MQHEIERPQMIGRREWLAGAAGFVVAATLGRPAWAADEVPESSQPASFRYCLNTSCIRGQKRPLAEEISIAAEVGYDGIEPWIGEIQQHLAAGGSLEDLRRHVSDSGLTVESAIGFARWIVDDESERKKGIEQLKRDMELVRAIGGTRIAAPPVGAHGKDAADLDLAAVADRYAAVLELGRETGVTPQLEIWGPSKNLSRLDQALEVLKRCDDPDACLLPDIYHMYRGGSDFAQLASLPGGMIHVFHVNDYPARPPQELNDSDRVYPGDGDAPMADILGMLQKIGFRGALSLELFNRDYWQQDPRVVAETGLKKMKAAVARLA